MFKMLNPSVFLLCLCLFLAGCGEKANEVEETSFSGQVSNLDELIKHAIGRQEVGAYDEAIEILDQVLKQKPQYAPAYYQKGLIYEEWDMRKEALVAYTKAVEINSTYNDARLGLASVYGKSVLNDLAVEQYLKVAETRNDDPDIHFKIALEYWYLQDIPKTAQYYSRVIEINPNHLQAHLNLISVYELMKNWQKALDEIEIVRRIAVETQNQHAINIAERKLNFIKGRMNLTKQEMKRKTEPPFN
jgi:tetratricopeptide (TPR) repeat protein